MDAQPRLLQPTALLDFTHPAIEAVVEERGWRQLPTFERIGAVYDFVRNEIAFGYNAGDELPASAVMADGIGQCNTKATLLIGLRLNPGVTLTESSALARQAEVLVKQVPEVTHVGRRSGRAELDEHAEGVHVSELDVGLKPTAELTRCV